MLIAGVLVSVLLLVTNIFLWKTAKAGIAFYYVVRQDDEDRQKLIRLTNISLVISLLSCLYLGGLITYLFLI